MPARAQGALGQAEWKGRESAPVGVRWEVVTCAVCWLVCDPFMQAGKHDERGG